MKRKTLKVKELFNLLLDAQLSDEVVVYLNREACAKLTWEDAIDYVGDDRVYFIWHRDGMRHRVGMYHIGLYFKEGFK